MLTTIATSRMNNFDYRSREKSHQEIDQKKSTCSMLIDILKSANADLPDELPYLPDCYSPCRRTPVLLAVQQGNAGNVEKLAKVGYSVNEPDRHGMSPLNHAARFGNAEVIKALLDKKADPLAADHYGCTALHKAASKGRSEALALMFEKVPNLDANLKTAPVACSPTSIAQSLIETPLHLAVRSCLCVQDCSISQKERQSSIEVLLNHGANPNEMDMNGDTPFLTAAKAGNWGAMCRLRRAGAVPTVSNKLNENALNIVEFNPNIDFKGKLAAKLIINGPSWAVAALEPFCWSRAN
jgi:ankyrin repeat protein